MNNDKRMILWKEDRKVGRKEGGKAEIRREGERREE